MIHIVMGAGRFNCPTIGHLRILKEVERSAKRHGVRGEIFVIEGLKTSLDKQKNPLSGEQRVRILKQWVPSLHFDIAGSPYDVMEILEVQNKEPIEWVTGADRVQNYEKLLASYGFKRTNVYGIERDESSMLGRVSATKARAAALAGNFEEFLTMMPNDIDRDSHREVYDLVREAMTEHEST